MKRIWAVMVGVLSLLLVTMGNGWAAQPTPGAAYRPGELIIKYKDGKAGVASAGLHQRHGSRQLREFKAYGLEHVKVRTGQSVQEAISAFEADGDVEYAEPNYIVHATVVPSDPSYSSLWGMTKISAPAAWDNSTGSQTVVIGTIDTGIDYTHPDLKANIWPGNGTYPANGYNAITHTYDPKDDNGHGSHVAGTIGAVGNNGVGVAGVNWNVQIAACKFLDASGSGSTIDAIECLNYFKNLKASGANVIATNNSWGGGGFSQSLYDAINAQRDILFIAAAGNSGANNDTTASYPSNYELPNVVAVAATDSADALASFSQYGRRTVDVAAPGVSIYSTYMNGGYATLSGTSMATPHVTGLAGLIKARIPTAEWSTIRNLILSTGDTVTAASGKTLTGKRINAYNALTCTDSRVLSAIQYPKTITVGTPATLSALSINCGDHTVDNVIVTLSGGEVITLLDNGTAPDLAAGDGIFSATFTPVRSTETFVFSSSAGIETIGNPPAALSVSTASLAAGTVGVSYSKTLAATGGVSPYSWSVSAGALPAGLSLSSSGVISGAPTTAGSYSFTVRVTDSKSATATRNLSITVAVPVQSLAITTTSLPAATHGVAYRQTVTASGGATPYTWSLSSGRLPSGLSLSSSTGVIGGTPRSSGTSTFTIRVRDTRGTTATKSLSLRVN
jgi:thermitase